MKKTLTLSKLQVEGIASLLPLLKGLWGGGLTMELLPDPPSSSFAKSCIVDISDPETGLGVAILEDSISIGSKSPLIDERFELIDYKNCTDLVVDCILLIQSLRSK